MLIVYGNHDATGLPSWSAGLKTHSAASRMRRRLKSRSGVGGLRRVESATTRPSSLTNTQTSTRRPRRFRFVGGRIIPRGEGGTRPGARLPDSPVPPPPEPVPPGTPAPSRLPWPVPTRDVMSTSTSGSKTTGSSSVTVGSGTRGGMMGRDGGIARLKACMPPSAALSSPAAGPAAPKGFLGMKGSARQRNRTRT